MKLAPIGAGRMASNLINQYMIGYQFLLAQKASRKEAEEFHKRGYFIILDNGAPEGELQTDDFLMEKFLEIRPDELILPDILEDAEGTLKKTFAFLNAHGGQVRPRNRMIVPQGKSVDEWEWCLDEFTSAGFEFESIGVPKHMEGKDGGRVACLQAIERRDLHRRCHVHMLGCFENPVREVRHALAAAPWVRGIDTAAPFAYAQHSADIQVGRHISYQWAEDFDLGVAARNMEALLRACQGG